MAGPFNNYIMQTPQSLAAGTQNKTTILARRRPITAGIVRSFFGYDGYVTYNGQEVGFKRATEPTQLDNYTRNVLRTLYSHEAYFGIGVANQVSSINAGLDSLSQGIAGELGLASAGIKDALKPVSTALGSTLGTLTNVLRDPIGAISMLPQTAIALISNISPEFAMKLEATFAKYKVTGLANLPGQVLGSVRSLVTLVDAVVTLPIIFISDLYNGLIDLLKELAEFVDQVISSIISFFWDILFGEDGLIPIEGILEFLQAVIELAVEIQALSNLFLGNNVIGNFAGQIANFANGLTSAFSNPIATLFAYLPSDITSPISQGLYYLRNPEALINNILPPEIKNLIGQVGNMAGVGYSGNAGYGLQSLLNGLRGGVISSILNNYSLQVPILKPLFGALGPTGPGGIGQTGGTYPGSYPPYLAGFPGNPNVPVDSQGIPQLQSPPPRPIFAAGIGAAGGTPTYNQSGQAYPNVTPNPPPSNILSITRTTDGRIEVVTGWDLGIFSNKNYSYYTEEEYREAFPGKAIPI